MLKLQAVLGSDLHGMLFLDVDCVMNSESSDDSGLVQCTKQSPEIKDSGILSCGPMLGLGS